MAESDACPSHPPPALPWKGEGASPPSPGGWLLDRAPGIEDGIWKLGYRQDAASDLFHEIRMGEELTTWMAVLAEGRRDQADGKPDLPIHDPHGLGKVRVIAEDGGTIHDPSVSIVDKVGGKIDVRALLLRAKDSHEARSIRLRKVDGVSQKLTQDDLDGRERAQSPEIRVLTGGLVWVAHSIVHPCVDFSRE